MVSAAEFHFEEESADESALTPAPSCPLWPCLTDSFMTKSNEALEMVLLFFRRTKMGEMSLSFLL